MDSIKEQVLAEWERIRPLRETHTMSLPRIYKTNAEYQAWRLRFIDCGLIIPKRGPKNIEERRVRWRSYPNTRLKRPKTSKSDTRPSYCTNRLVREVIKSLALKGHLKFDIGPAKRVEHPITADVDPETFHHSIPQRNFVPSQTHASHPSTCFDEMKIKRITLSPPYSTPHCHTPIIFISCRTIKRKCQLHPLPQNS